MPPKKRRVSTTSQADSEPQTKSSKGEQEHDQPETHTKLTSYRLDHVYRLIEPGPVLLVTTGSLKDGSHNIMTIGFHMMIQHSGPALIGACIGPWDASYSLLKHNKECVLAIPSVDMAETVVDIGNCSGEEVDKWARFGLEALRASKVKAPLVGNASVIANVECVVEDTKLVGAYNLWVLRAVKAWGNPDEKKGREGGKMFHHRGDGTFVVDGEKLDLRERMVKWQEFQD
ncbi:hypothetical protein DTO021D3_1558 [Paecilomyces variotii]|nr:hypothetical protein DTO032I3_1410 [Paecilomyces variotii]KAJ9281335.1 hypothetical protein DTO021D3_1558 [Paecilomyces variotii]KAJ9290352.1 hypothetical protein DTO021C3_1976 [Paecilomyces variotii]KAJ9346594.1 hypothetical protein DTO027B6_848 [Paecilomyces variotii]KAJ9391201.1 hypothetical protein DTO032I4_1557 [Paecilomyces variotii]